MTAHPPQSFDERFAYTFGDGITAKPWSAMLAQRRNEESGAKRKDFGRLQLQDESVWQMSQQRWEQQGPTKCLLISAPLLGTLGHRQAIR